MKQIRDYWTQMLSGRSLLSIGLALLIYGVVLTVGVPDGLAQAARFDAVAILPAAILLYGAFALRGWIGQTLSLTLILVLFALPLLALWQGHGSDRYVIGGLIPWSDASTYYVAAQQVQNGQLIDHPYVRPWFAGNLATLLTLTQHHLPIALAIFTALMAIAVWVAAHHLKQSHGIATAVTLLMGLFWAYRYFNGKTATEVIGLILGTLGFALLWRSATHLNAKLWLIGLLLLTLALNARAGAFFVLPMLVFWGTWNLATHPQPRQFPRQASQLCLIGFGVVLLGFVLNSVLMNLIGPDAIPFENFAYAFYGLLAGGNWQQVLTDHPEILDLPQPDRAPAIYSLAFEILRQDPIKLVHGALRAWRYFLFGHAGFNPLQGYAFVLFDHDRLESIFHALSLSGLLLCLLQCRRHPHASLVLAANLGFLASIPLVPPWDSGARTYTPTLPFALAPSVLAIGWMEWQLLRLIGLLRQKPPQILGMNSPPKISKATDPWIAVGISVVVIIVIGAIALKPVAASPDLPRLNCPRGQRADFFRISPGAYVHLIPDSQPLSHAHPWTEVHLSDFRNGLTQHRFDQAYPDESAGLAALPADTFVLNTLRLKRNARMLIIIPGDRLDSVDTTQGLMGACGNITRFGNRGVFQAESLQFISP